MANPRMRIETSLGAMTLELDADKAPLSVHNFLSYVDDKFFDGTIFHRVIATFMIQGGGFEPGMTQKKTNAAIKNESPNGLLNVRGAIAMARTNDLHSATSQFFINVVDNAFLDDNKYCVFGQIVEGIDVLDKIKAVKTGRQGVHADVPNEDVIIRSIRRA